MTILGGGKIGMLITCGGGGGERTFTYCILTLLCVQALSSRTRELERLKSEWSAHTTALANEHSAQLTAEREKGVASQEESQQRYEQEKRSLEQAHSARVRLLSCVDTLAIHVPRLSSSSLVPSPSHPSFCLVGCLDHYSH